MYRLAKAGFSQSYTYFTWRNSKAELTRYLSELVHEAPRDFFRPNFWPNTPDILPEYLQYSSFRPGKPFNRFQWYRPERGQVNEINQMQTEPAKAGIDTACCRCYSTFVLIELDNADR